MKIKYLAHSSFLITSESGVKIITDPYTRNERMQYGEIKETADVVTVSHEHGDHNNTAAVQGKPTVLREGGTIKGITFQAFPAHHDATGGQQRGNVTIFCFEVDGIRVCHLGDLGHPLDKAQVAALGRVDVLLLPVGGYYTIDAAVASRVAAAIQPKLLLPMHYKTAKSGLPISGVDEFLRDKPRETVSRLEVSELEVKRDKLPAATQIVLLKPAR